jgi:membrane-bound serine protease (ClpP class)
MKQKHLLCLLVLAGIFLHGQAFTNTDTNLVYVFDIKDQIGPKVWRMTQQSLEEARALKADHIFIRMNTYGGMVVSADSIRTRVLNFPVPVYVFIDNNAASAGALISIACNKIYMRPGANIGAATVVNQTGEEMPDKYQSYMRSTMRATAEAHGKDTIVQGTDTVYKWKRDPRIAEAMVDERIAIPGISDSGKVLTFTTKEAIQHGFCEGEANSLKEAIEKAGIEDYVIKEYKPSNLEKTIGFLVNPALQGILIMIIIGGIYFELQSPGIGFPLVAAALAAVLYFAPLYLEGLAENWELVLFALGLLLVGVEIFAIPGFGVAGIAGITLMIAGLTLSMVDKIVWEFEGGNLDNLVKALFTVVVSMFLSLVLSIIASRKIFGSRRFPGLALDSIQNVTEGYVSGDATYHSLKGKIGVAHTVLRPSGKVELENEIYDARSESGFINKGDKVKILKYETGQLYVFKHDG